MVSKKPLDLRPKEVNKDRHLFQNIFKGNNSPNFDINKIKPLSLIETPNDLTTLNSTQFLNTNRSDFFEDQTAQRIDKINSRF